MNSLVPSIRENVLFIYFAPSTKYKTNLLHIKEEAFIHDITKIKLIKFPLTFSPFV